MIIAVVSRSDTCRDSEACSSLSKKYNTRSNADEGLKVLQCEARFRLFVCKGLLRKRGAGASRDDTFIGLL